MTANPGTLSELLGRARAVLFDFDGPLCDVFSGLPASVLARQLAGLLGHESDTDDPLQVLRESASFGESYIHRVEQALIAAEIAAVDCSERVQGGVEAIQSCLLAGKSVGIVSNNSVQAVERFLRREDVSLEVNFTIGRPLGNPSRMKPHPWSMMLALDKLDMAPSQVVYIGDSITDIEVSRLVNIPCIAYANKAGKKEIFLPDASVVIDSMREVVAAL